MYSSGWPSALRFLDDVSAGNAAGRSALFIALILILVFSGVSIVAAQMPATLKPPVLGYLLDPQIQSIRPILGILGNASIGVPLELGLSAKAVIILADQEHALVSSPDVENMLVVNLETLASVRIPELPLVITAMRASANGSQAAFYDENARKIAVVGGLPSKPALHAMIDVSFTNRPLAYFSIADSGDLVLLSFSSTEDSLLYSWTPTGTIRLVTRASDITDIAYLGRAIVIADARANEVLFISNVQEGGAPVVIGNERDGISQPIAIVTDKDRILVGNAGNGLIVVFDSNGQVQRRIACNCALRELSPLVPSTFLLTTRLDQPLTILDASSRPERTLFIPALQAATQGFTE